MAKEMTDHVSSMEYINDPMSRWCWVIRDQFEVLSWFVASLVPWVRGICIGHQVVILKWIRMC